MNVLDKLPLLEAEVRRLGALQLQGGRALRAEQIQIKSSPGDGHSLVTDIDLESERQIRAFLRREFPDHSFLGEETGHDQRDPEHYWILDPIDGTTNFAAGIPFWGPSLAYWHAGETQLALIGFPALDLHFQAVRGRGATLNGEPIHTSDTREYGPLTTVALHSRTHYAHRLNLRAKVRILGSIIGNMCLMARGTFVAAHGRGRLWDVAAGLLILEEAGAIVETDPDHRLTRPADYDGEAAPVFTVLARANRHLPPLSEYLEPVRSR